MITRGEQLKLVRVWDSLVFIRSGFWACHNCSAHNLTTYSHCLICGVKHWRLEMPLNSIPAGPPTAILQNTSYALPAGTVFIVSTAALQFSNDNSNWSADVAASTTGIQSSYGWCRCTTAAPTVTVRKY